MELFIDFVMIVGIVIISLLCLSIMRKEKKEMAHRILLVLLFLVFFRIVGGYGVLHKIKGIWLVAYLLTESMSYLMGPLFYLYIKSLYQQEDSFLKKHWFHFIPFLLDFVVLTIPVFITFVIGKPTFQYLENMNDTMFPYYDWLFQGLFTFTYIFIAYRLFKKYQDALKLNFSNLSRFDLNWVKYLLIGALIISGVDIATSVYELLYGEMEFNAGFVSAILMVLLVIFLGYYGSNQSRILLPDFIIKEATQPEVKIELGVKSHHLSNTSQEEIEKLQVRLLAILKEDKPYLDEDLTLGTLAEMIPTTDKKLSALLNHYLDISFYDLINQYRVEEVKAKMADENFENYTLLALAFDSGFKSKTSFNRIFKKITGYSPSAYKKQI